MKGKKSNHSSTQPSADLRMIRKICCHIIDLFWIRIQHGEAGPKELYFFQGLWAVGCWTPEQRSALSMMVQWRSLLWEVGQNFLGTKYMLPRKIFLIPYKTWLSGKKKKKKRPFHPRSQLTALLPSFSSPSNRTFNIFLVSFLKTKLKRVLGVDYIQVRVLGMRRITCYLPCSLFAG